MSQETSHAPTRLITVKDWPNHHPWPSERTLRAFIFRREENGFAKVIRRFGRRVLLDEAAFFKWAEEHAEAPTPAAAPKATGGKGARR